ncbi:MAG: flagellar basal body-associated FliL family protein [Spirochaetia bacterium]|nr:flagellar basal body-associated FliL family protein [Spirochaetota bacterium]MCX8096654.1 flagellar basal body-associated FliL family protein [Spirochaetota bacterium]MDW8112485.1 flagellar basal body-associated FliL family protein [Spirochaetia bacterium]
MGDDEKEELQVEAPEGEEAAKKPGFSLGAIIEWILSHVLQLVIAGIIAAIVAFIVVSQMRARVAEEIVVARGPIKKEPPPMTFDLGSFNINTADTDEPHFVRVKIYVAYPEKNNPLMMELGQRKFQMRDIVITTVSSMKKEDLDEPIEREELKERLKKLMNNILVNGEILDIFFDEFTVY